ncbi:hypothetical protein GCM10022415_34150 [Knoellia locipacati]|uniref:Helix-hairpin-helix DNA-binding motif class 1 domain-containing protein n=1 Tax=Knoellia locipacati TaxID=882824 RepID=A0A512T5K7_9MICO|nr:ComEA family DNA-binding protein [Knoellia locipacati]GEQ15361.1 hypothetical protein KLO01_34080 [Knoellia locipacati]
MPSRRDPEALSPRALARVRSRDPDPGVGQVEGAERGRHRPLEVTRGPVFELPSSLRGARWAPSRSAALGVLVVVVLVALVFGVRVWWAGSGGDTVGARAPDSAVAGVSRGTSTLSRASPTGSPTGPAATAAGSPTESGGGAGTGAAAALLVVHVVGQVRTPGVYRMPAGSRVGDAVTAAGGATRSADLAAVNLARVLVDGEQVVVPRPGESVGTPVPGGGGAGGSTDSGGAQAGAGGAAGGKVALNSADLSALDTLPGVGPVLAQRILDWRTEHGRFTSVEELGEVSGIGEKLLAQLTPKVTL